ncbi:MAG: major facilitator superfamily 1 [Verrucomicrobia bacterium]|nr:major facilitator superfamily 1 [Verrucomicrobiota bacterium]
MASPTASTEPKAPRLNHPPGFRPRRGLNWAVVGLTYTSYYLCRYNFSYANKAIADEFHFTKSDMSTILSANFVAYGCGQIINGLLTDRIGGKRAMLIGAGGTVLVNVLFGASSFLGLLSLFSLLWGINGYVQAFGSPGFIKINSAWFSQSERGTFAGIFGCMINLGRLLANKLLPALLAGFVFLGMWNVPPQHWRWLFWIPAGVATAVAIVLALVVKDTPEEAGFRNVFPGEADHADQDARSDLAVVFRQIVSNRVVWIMAVAYACTGAVRQSIDQWFPVYFQEVHHLQMTGPKFQWLGFLIPFVASAGSLLSGWVSDRFCGARRAPVAAGVYAIEVCVILAATQVSTVDWALGFFVLIAFTVNSTHSLLGPAAAMDIGGRKMAGFASGVIDSFQYFGAAIATKGLGWILDHKGWSWYFPYLIPFGILGFVMMYSIAHLKSLKKGAG